MQRLRTDTCVSILSSAVNNFNVKPKRGDGRMFVFRSAAWMRLSFSTPSGAAFVINAFDETRDKDRLVELLGDKEVTDTLLVVPHPYTIADCEAAFKGRQAWREQHGCDVSWAIRNADGDLVGAISLKEYTPGASHSAELGYWLGRPYWGKGIMPEAVRVMRDYCVDVLGLVRVTATVFDFNAASARVLQKAGFQLEGKLQKRYRKGDRYIDALLFAFVTP